MSNVKNIGFVSYWFNRGQAVVTKQIRSIYDDAGYNTFLLVRSAKKETGSGDWAGKNITIGSKEYNLNKDTYIKWVKKNNIDVVFFFQNYQFEEIEAIRNLGVKTIGTFMWEQFCGWHVSKAKRAYDVIYSLTKCQHEKYIDKFGIDSKFIRWGIYPSLLEYSITKRKDGLIWFYYPAGYCSLRKSVYETIDAFSSIKNKNIRLLVTSQRPINSMLTKTPDLDASYSQLIKNIKDPRIKLSVGNVLSHDHFYKMMHSCDVCIIPSKWEGLGLSFLEAIAFRLPILTTNYPPMNEYVVNKKTGFLVKCKAERKRKNGFHIADISTYDLAKKISAISNLDSIKIMSKNTKNILQKKYDWKNTREDFLNLINGL